MFDNIKRYLKYKSIYNNLSLMYIIYNIGASLSKQI